MFLLLGERTRGEGTGVNADTLNPSAVQVLPPLLEQLAVLGTHEVLLSELLSRQNTRIPLTFASWVGVRALDVVGKASLVERAPLSSSWYRAIQEERGARWRSGGCGQVVMRAITESHDASEGWMTLASSFPLPRCRRLS